jgi:hypothetical protein
MNTKLLASLEDALEEWCNSEREMHNLPNTLFYTDQVRHMALAASLVFDASEQAQIFKDNDET